MFVTMSNGFRIRDGLDVKTGVLHKMMAQHSTNAKFRRAKCRHKVVLKSTVYIQTMNLLIDSQREYSK